MAPTTESGFVDNTSALSVPVPASAITGDLVLVHVMSQSANPVITPPANLIELVPFRVNGDYSWGLYYRVIQAGDISFDFVSSAYDFAWITTRTSGNPGIGSPEYAEGYVTGTQGLATGASPGEAASIVTFAGCDLDGPMTWTASQGTKAVDEVVGEDFLSQACWVEDVSASVQILQINNDQGPQYIHAVTVALTALVGTPAWPAYFVYDGTTEILVDSIGVYNGTSEIDLSSSEIT